MVKVPVTINFASALQAANAIRQGKGQLALTGQLQSGTASLPINLSEFENFLRWGWRSRSFQKKSNRLPMTVSWIPSGGSVESSLNGENSSV